MHTLLQVTLRQKESELHSLVYPYSKSYGKTSISTVVGGPDGGKSLVSSWGACAKIYLAPRVVDPWLIAHVPPLRGTNKACTVPCTQIGRTLRVGGWVKTGREAGAGAFAFLEVNDGSSAESLQVGPRGRGVAGLSHRGSACTWPMLACPQDCVHGAPDRSW